MNDDGGSQEKHPVILSEKKQYIKPEILSEDVFVKAQSCGKCDSGPYAQAGCLSVPQAS